jgi:hypothetical protein
MSVRVFAYFPAQVGIWPGTCAASFSPRDPHEV